MWQVLLCRIILVRSTCEQSRPSGFTPMTVLQLLPLGHAVHLLECQGSWAFGRVNVLPVVTSALKMKTLPCNTVTSCWSYESTLCCGSYAWKMTGLGEVIVKSAASADL